MAADRFSIYTAYINAAFSLTQMDNQSVDPGNSFDEIIAGGTVDRGAVVLSHATPAVVLSTADITKVFANVSGTTGLNCSSGAIFQFQKRDADNSGVFDGTSAHVRVTSTKGFLHPENVGASQNQQARMQLRYTALYDGTNEPLVMTTGAALTGTAPAYNSVFYLGPCMIAGSQIEGLTSSRVDFGLRFAPTFADGVAWPKTGAIVARTPRISLTFLKTSIGAANFTSIFNQASSGNIDVYFQKGSSGGIRVAAASTVHLKVRASASTGAPNQVQVGGEGDATITLDIYPTAALTVSLAAIT